MFYIDDREPNEKVQRFRQALGDSQVTVARTEIADYYLDNFILGIERKSPSDYIKSFCSEKLFSQATELARIFAHPYVVVEGSLRELIYAKKGLHLSSLLGSIASLEAHYNVHVLTTAMFNPNRRFDSWVEEKLDLDDYFVGMVLKLINKFTDGNKGDYSPLRQIVRPTATIQDQQLFALSALPGIQDIRARRLLKHFGSVHAVIDASVEDLCKVEGIGKEIAEGIHRVTR